MAGVRDAGTSRCSASEVSTSDGSAKIKIVYGVCVCFSVGLSLDYKDCFCRDGVGSHDSAVDSDVHKPKHPAARVLEQKVREDSHSQSISRVSDHLTSLQLCRLCVCVTLCVCVCQYCYVACVYI